jgi:DNA polymerase III epsilon subunit-like protein
MQFGFCVVINRKVQSNFAIMINHGAGLQIHPGAFKAHGIDHARMAREGIPPEEGLKIIFDTFAAYKKNRFVFVGHNLLNFDVPFFERESRMAGAPVTFDSNEVLDTGMIVKAAQLGMHFSPNDTMRSFFKRVSGVRAKGVYWALDKHCYDTFSLGQRAGVSKEQAHDAGVDCLLCHHTLEALRERVVVA